MLKIITLTITHKPSNHDNSYDNDNMLACAPGLYVYTHMYIYIYIHTHAMQGKCIGKHMSFQTFHYNVFQFPMSKFSGEMLLVPSNCASTIIRTVCPPLLGCTPSKSPSFFGHRLGRDNS